MFLCGRHKSSGNGADAPVSESALDICAYMGHKYPGLVPKRCLIERHLGYRAGRPEIWRIVLSSHRPGDRGLGPQKTVASKTIFPCLICGDPSRIGALHFPPKIWVGSHACHKYNVKNWSISDELGSTDFLYYTMDIMEYIKIKMGLNGQSYNTFKTNYYNSDKNKVKYLKS